MSGILLLFAWMYWVKPRTMRVNTRNGEQPEVSPPPLPPPHPSPSEQDSETLLSLDFLVHPYHFVCAGSPYHGVLANVQYGWAHFKPIILSNPSLRNMGYFSLFGPTLTSDICSVTLIRTVYNSVSHFYSHVNKPYWPRRLPYLLNFVLHNTSFFNESMFTQA
jgi:hypothetical protein